ncbi:peroxiredoxin family protein [Rubripirellula lacrimiformis]|nr:peroxiredoxin family protein [Rubripirellula lacrimiformis]
MMLLSSVALGVTIGCTPSLENRLPDADANETAAANSAIDAKSVLDSNGASANEAGDPAIADGSPNLVAVAPTLNGPANAAPVPVSDDKFTMPAVSDQTITSSAPESQTVATQLVAVDDKIEFTDHVKSNREDDGSIAGLSFIDTQGNDVTVGQYKGKKHVLLVFTRGFNGSLCPYCTTQTSRLIANYDEFKRRDTEILLVYPGSKDQLPQFLDATRRSPTASAFPFPVLLDEDLVAVKKLQISAHLAFPSTFLIDRDGNVRLSYVGASPSDRPSIKALLEQVDQLGS